MRLIDADAFKEYMRSALEQTRRCYPDGGEWAEAVTEEFCRDIDAQPSAQPERKRGKWIWSPVADDGTVSGCCNKCSFSHVFIGGHTAQYNYCPSCGADMRR